MGKRPLVSIASETNDAARREGHGAATVARGSAPAPDDANGHAAEQPEMLTYVGLSRVTGIRVATLYGMVCRDEIPHYRLAPRIIRFSASEIAAWMATRHQPARGAR